MSSASALAGLGLYVSIALIPYPAASSASILRRLRLGTSRPSGCGTTTTPPCSLMASMVSSTGRHGLGALRTNRPRRCP